MKLRYLFIAALAACLVSCESRLDIRQHGVVSMDEFYSTPEDFEEAIASVYVAYQTNYYNMWFTKEYLSDDLWHGGGTHYDGEDYRLSDYCYNAGLSTLENLFSGYYTVLNRANLVIENVPEEESVGKRCVAEARVFRALVNFDLVTLWGTPPLVDHILAANEYQPANVESPSVIWAAIEEDLEKAISSGALTDKSSLSDKTAHITHQFAKALLGKTYVFQGKWGEARIILDEVVSSEKYDLYDDYATIRTIAGEFNQESVFELEYPLDSANPDGNGHRCWQQTYFGLSTRYFSISDDCELQDGWNYCHPTKSLYDAFVSIEGVDGYRLNSTIKTLDQIRSLGVEVVERCPDNEGYFSWKIRIRKDEYQWYNPCINQGVMRFAEVLLLAAEAHLNGGEASVATGYINRLRVRAQAPLITGIATMDELKNEKRVELCYEMTRYQDLIRWGDASTVLADKGKHYPNLEVDGSVSYTDLTTSSTEYGFKDKHKLLPFPSAEIMSNVNITQNPGW